MLYSSPNQAIRKAPERRPSTFDFRLLTFNSRLSTFDFRLPKSSQQIHRSLLEFLPGCRMVSDDRPVDRMAALAAVNLGAWAKILDSFLFVRRGGETVAIVVIPPLQVAHTELALGVFLITGPLARFLLFDCESHRDLLAARLRCS